jgi:hypothetical protein
LARLDHGRDGNSTGVPYTREVDAHHVFPLLLRGCRAATGPDTGVGQHYADRSELRRPFVEHSLQRGNVTNVGLAGDDAPPQRFDLLNRLLQVLRSRHRIGHRVDLLAYVDGDDIGTLLSEPDRVATALTARGPGDECNLAVELSHFYLLIPGRTGLRHGNNFWMSNRSESRR